MLVLTGYYLPGHRAGGPVRSISNMVERLGDEFEFWIVAPDRDFGSDEPYEGVDLTRWTPLGKAQVRYVSPAMARRGAVTALAAATEHDLMYLNSFFHPSYTLRPLAARRFAGLRTSRVLVAPRGELGRGALRLKALKKRPFIVLGRLTGLYDGVAWHATAPEEQTDIRRLFGPKPRVFVAPNLGSPGFLRPPSAPPPEKRPGAARLVFASRIMRGKNLAYLVEALGHLRGDVALDVFGPLQDPAYWEHCEQLAQRLPPNVSMSYRGEVSADDMPATLDRYHLFVLPTLAENFGHAIVEALGRGLPAVISDTTPWGEIEARGAGRVVPLGDPRRFAEAIQHFVNLAAPEYDRYRAAARTFGRARIDDADAVEATRQMLAANAGAADDGGASHGTVNDSGASPGEERG